jgi:predicted NAD/FAD-dependent oxidoreductase
VGSNVVNNVCVPSNVAPLYAPPQQHLISVSILGLPDADDEVLQARVRTELRAWFGNVVHNWRWLRTYRIEHALPNQTPPALAIAERPTRLTNALFVAGDHRATASIQGALVSGRLAAEEIAVQIR